MKKSLLLLLVCAMILSLAACGQTAPTTGTATVAPSNSAASASLAPDKKVTLKLGLPEGYTLTPEEIVTNFKTANPNITLEVDDTPWADFMTKLQTQIAGGNPPDVFFTDCGHAQSLGYKGATMDLSSFMNSELKADEYSSSLFAAKDSNGKVWGAPHAVNPVAIAYNKDLFDAAKIPYPTEDWTFQEMLDIAKQMTQDTDKDGKTDIYGLLTDVKIAQGWLPFITAAGGVPLDETRTISMFNDPKTVDGMNKWYSAIQEGIVPPRSWLESFGGYRQAFGANKGAMLVIQASNGTKINKETPDLNYDVVVMPTGWDGKKHVLFVANQWVVYSKSTDDAKTAALAWIKHWLSADSQKIYAKTCPAGYPVNNAALKDVAAITSKPANKDAFIGGMDNYGVSVFENYCWQEWTTETNKIMLDMYDGKINAQDAAALVHTTVQSILDANKK